MISKAQLIADLRQELAKTKQSGERLRAFMDSSPAVEWMKHDQGRYVCVNKTFENLFRISFEDRHGKTDSEVWPPEIAERFQENDRAVLMSGKEIETIRDVPAPGMTRFTWKSFKFPFVDSSGNQYVGGGLIGAGCPAHSQSSAVIEEG